MVDLKINEKEYLGVKEVQIPFSDGTGNAVFKLSEIMESTLLCTLESEMMINEIFAKHPIPRKYNDSAIFVRFNSDTAPTQGNDTSNWIVIFCSEEDITESYHGGNKTFGILSYTNGLKVLNELDVPASLSPKYGNSIMFNEQGSVTFFPSTTYIPVGAEIRFLELPLAFSELISNPFS